MTKPHAEALDTHPLGCSWERYVEALVRGHGGWTALADQLVHKVSGEVDLAAAEKGLRRLAARGNKPGGQYGGWLLRYFGPPLPLERWACWMGQYHTRFSDLPVSLREPQLLLWDRPPISDSPLGPWIELGLAAVAMRRRDEAGARQRLERAQRRANTSPSLQAEAHLLAARLDADIGAWEKATHALSLAESATDAIEGSEREAYSARLADQKAYRLLRPPSPDIARALLLYQAIPENSASPFVRFRRAHGVAYCLFKQGAHAEAIVQARAAAEHAADGGLVRFRALALDLLSHIVPREEALPIAARAASLARYLEDEELLARLA